MKKNKNFLIVIVIFSLAIGGFFFAKVQAGSNLSSELKPLFDTYQEIQSWYIEKIKPSRLIEGAIKGMIESLEDPYSHWMDAQSYKEMEQEREGQFGGLGIEITLKDEILTIVSPLEGTPASEAGLQPWDKIIEINGESTQGITSTEAMQKLRGEPGTVVTLTIQREEEKDPLLFTITRGIIEFPNVKEELLDENIGYIRIVGFTNENTAKDLRAALAELKDREAVALILDLRYNPGGLLTQAIEVADEFLSPNEFLPEVIIVSTKGRDFPQNPQNRVYYADEQGEWLELPLVILINEGSASASEIVAAAIKDNNRGTLIGSKSFGKGTVQSVRPLENYGAIALTTAKYLTPSGVCIEGEGIEPCIKVKAFKLTEEEEEVLAKLEKSELIDEFLTQYPQWEAVDLASLISGLEKEEVKVNEDLLRRYLRWEDDIKENDILNDLQLLKAIEIIGESMNYEL